MASSHPLHRLDEKIAALEAAAADIAVQTREAHEAIQRLNEVKREVRSLLDTEGPALVNEAIDGQVQAFLADFTEKVGAAQRSIERKIENDAKRLMAMWLGEPDDEGTPVLLDLAMARRKAQNIQRETGR